MTERQVMDAIATITSETGFPPDATELARALDCSTTQVHAALRSAKWDRRVRYDDDERFVLGGHSDQ